jgi:uncharacterized protein (TIGR03643 family)
MKHIFKPEEVEQIILMAWADTIPFETIFLEYGLTQNEVQKFMSKHQSPTTYVRWRKRVERRRGESSKHRALSSKTSHRQKF